MARLFGTDGVRGVAGTELTSFLAMNIGSSLAHILKKTNDNVIVIIGSDTRISKDMLVSSLSAGLCEGGANVINVGIVPTPAISYLVEHYKASAGVMITASHNPYQYNGIKIFNSKGFKLDDNLEDEIQELIEQIDTLPKSETLGQIAQDNSGLDHYIDHLLETKTADLSKLNILVDCSNGSASLSAPLLFEKLGCNYKIINNNYNGININENCGSTHIENLKTHLINGNYDLGFAFDGDADRCLILDKEGNLVDGDHILAITSNYLKEHNQLNNNTVVGTIMSNLGFIKYCQNYNINFIPTKVGDRYVLEEMNINNYNLGGEQSGHIIFKDHAVTGDGQLTAIQILNIISNTNKSLTQLASIMTKYPQVMVNITISNDKKNEFYTNPKITEAISKVENILKDDGRVVVRPSGTEPLIRVMIEGSNQETITKYANNLAEEIKKILN